MTNRVTEKDLNIIVSRLNQLTGYGRSPDYSVIGSYTIDYAYGGVSLHKYCNEHGAVSDVFRCGHIPKRDLYHRICAYIDGIEAGEGEN